MTQDVLARLHLALVQALRSRGPDALERPVTVAEVYQDLIPYRVARAVAGIELNADYEHALLRLFAGEGGRVRLEPATAREELLRELDSPNPNVSLYRKFAACDAWITVPPELARPPQASAAPAAGGDTSERPAASAEPKGAAASSPGGTPAATATAGPTAGTSAAAAITSSLMSGRPQAGAEAPRSAGGNGPAAAPAPGACAFCKERLPEGRPVRFCPYCGTDQSKTPCARCGEVLESGWKYCIACGAPAATPVAAGRS